MWVKTLLFDTNSAFDSDMVTPSALQVLSSLAPQHMASTDAAGAHAMLTSAFTLAKSMQDLPSQASLQPANKVLPLCMLSVRSSRSEQGATYAMLPERVLPTLVCQVRALSEFQVLRAATGNDADVLKKNRVYLEQKETTLAARQAAAIAAEEDHMAVMAWGVA